LCFKTIVIDVTKIGKTKVNNNSSSGNPLPGLPKNQRPRVGDESYRQRPVLTDKRSHGTPKRRVKRIANKNTLLYKSFTFKYLSHKYTVGKMKKMRIKIRYLGI